MIRIYYYLPRYNNTWYSCVHIYRYGFVIGMRRGKPYWLTQNADPDPNFIAGFAQGQGHHNQWKLKQLLKGKQT